MDSVIKTHTPIEVTHKQEDNHNCRGSLQEAKDLPLIKLGFPAWGSCMRQGTVGNRDSSFKGCVQRLYMEARFRLNALIFQSLLERQQVTKTPLRDKHTDGSHFWKLNLPKKQNKISSGKCHLRALPLGFTCPPKNQHQPWGLHESHSQQSQDVAQQRACSSLRAPLALQSSALGSSPTLQLVSRLCT